MKNKVLNFLFDYGYELFYFIVLVFLSAYLLILSEEVDKLKKEQIEINKEAEIKKSIDSFYIFDHSQIK